MSTETNRITVGGLTVEVVRKDIKNLHLGVYPPRGWVRVAAPLAVSDDAVRLAVIGKLGWIKRRQAQFAAQPRQSRREMVSGESHYFLGRRYRLRVHEHDGPAIVALHGATYIDLYVRPGTTREQRELVLRRWYRARLKALIPPLVEQWQRILDVQVAAWGVKRMKTKWGSCNVAARRIWFNLELAKKPERRLEYIVAHELAHLRERRHDERFIALLDHHMPRWRELRDELKPRAARPRKLEQRAIGRLGMRQRLLAVLNGATWTLLLLVVIGGIVALAWGLYALIHPLISWLPLTLQVAVTAVLTTLLVSGSSQLLKRRRSRRR